MNFFQKPVRLWRKESQGSLAIELQYFLDLPLMKPVVVILTLVMLLGTVSVRAQESRSSSASVLDNLVRLSQFQSVFDSLKPNVWSDSLKAEIGIMHRTDSLNLVSKIDSLRNLDLPALPFQQKLDSLLAKRDALILEVENKKQ